MTQFINLSSDTLTKEQIHKLAVQMQRTMSRHLRINVDFKQTHTAEKTKGIGIDVSTLTTAFISSGSAVALFQIFRSYLDRDKSIEIELQNENGKRIKINAKNMDATTLQEYLKICDKHIAESHE